MFKRDVLNISEVVRMFLRQSGLETPLLQRRLIDAWGGVAGRAAERYTKGKFIKNGILYVKITVPALRSDLYMMRGELVRRLNNAVGAHIITDIRIY